MTLGELLRAVPSLGDGNELPVYVISPSGERRNIDIAKIAKDCIELYLYVGEDIEQAEVSK